jgi:glycosyltransferase involved in cell wall biosynthesis
VRDWHRYRMPSRIVAISEKTRSDLSMLGVAPSRVDVVPTGIHMDQWSPTAQPDDEARRTKHVPSGTRYLLYVGYCDHRKNVRGMMETLAKARRDEPLELVWAGDLPPPQLAAMKKLAREIGVEDSVRFLGFVADPNLAALYRGATALLFLSRLEGFGLPVAEAMASGCPSIVCRSSGSDDVAGEAGLVVDSDDIPAAADAVLKLCRSAELRANLAKLGLARVGRFDRRAMARGYVESYLRVANTRKSS